MGSFGYAEKIDVSEPGKDTHHSRLPYANRDPNLILNILRLFLNLDTDNFRDPKGVVIFNGEYPRGVFSSEKPTILRPLIFSHLNLIHLI